MDVKAILLLGPASDPKAPEGFGGVPIALLEVLGRSLVQRTADRLRRYGVSQVTVLGDVNSSASRFVPRVGRDEFDWLATPGPLLWRAAEEVFAKYAQNGADLVFVLRLGPYAEVNYEAVIQSHLDHNARVTAITDESGEPLGIFMLSTSRRNDAAFLLRNHLQESRTAPLCYRFSGYCNALANMTDLRQFAVDAFCGCAQIAPDGVEVKPGVWLGDGARIHPRARVLAPAFLGRHVKVGASAVVTRTSVPEHHTVVNCGTVIENATILPYTRIGAGLDIAHSVVGFGRVAHLRQQVEVVVSDRRLISSAPSAPMRLMSHAASLFSRWQFDLLRGLVGRGPQAAESPVALTATEPLPAANDPALSNLR